MTRHELMKAPGMPVALGVAALAAALFLTAAARAIRIDEGPPAPTSVPPASLALYAPPPPPEVDVAAIVDNDVFSIDRAAPAQRYRLPGEEVAVAVAPPPPREPPRPLVLGTVINGDSALSFATVQMSGGRATNLRIGGKIGEYTVVAIDKRKVTFVGPSGTPVEVYVSR